MTNPRHLTTVFGMLALLASWVLAACGPATPLDSSLPAGPTPTVTVPFELPIVIAIAGRFDDQSLAILDEKITRFEEENPDIRVAVMDAPEDESERHDAFAALLAEGDTAIDVYVLDPTWLAEFDASGWLISLDESVTIEGQSLGLSMHSLYPDQALRLVSFLAR
jgi:ABC-type glycerol-3-phosphate transport system substrate-binding protein